MKIILLVVGKTTDRHIQALTDTYAERIGHYIPFQTVVVPELRNTRALTPAQQKQQEAQGIRKALQPADYVVLLDEHGAERRSVDFAAWIEKRIAAGGHRLVFVVGGPYGFDAEIYALAAEKVSLSQMTFSHQMIRPLFTEQIYRAMTILRGEPYHHE